MKETRRSKMVLTVGPKRNREGEWVNPGWTERRWTDRRGRVHIRHEKSEDPLDFVQGLFSAGAVVVILAVGVWLLGKV